MVKLTITLTQDEQMGTDEGMAKTLSLLAKLGTQPTRKIVLNLECKDVKADELRAAIRSALFERPVGIAVVMKTTQEEDVYCSPKQEKFPPINPMDKAGWN